MLAGLAASFLPKIASVLLPALGVGAAQELAATAVKKIVGNGQQSPSSGNGLYIKKGGCICKIETDGKGIYLDSAIKGSGLKHYRNGFYLRNENGVQKIEGSGFFDSIPIIGPILHSLFNI